jgi:hypothetical protein
LPTTPEQRDRHALCGAKKRKGGKCRLYAGQRTDHPGVGHCYLHGGATPNGKKHAVTLEARRAMVKLGVPIEDITAPDALMGLLRATSGHVAWLHAQLADLDDLADHEAQIIVKLYDAERDRLVRIGEACIRAGVAEAQVRIMSGQIAVLGSALQRAAAKAGLSDAQRQRLGAALRDELSKSETRARKGRDDAGAIFVNA